MPQWQWDATRQQHYYYNAETHCWMYQSGEIIENEARENENREKEDRENAVVQNPSDFGDISTFYPRECPRTEYSQASFGRLQLSILRDNELYSRSQRLFDSPPYSYQLHFIDVQKEHISLLVCQHVTRRKPGLCLEPWEHFHLGTVGKHPSMALYLDHGNMERRILVLDLGSYYISTDDLIYFLKKATRNYRAHMLAHLSNRTGTEADSSDLWGKFHDTELKHYKWLQVYTMPSYPPLVGDFYVSGVVCPECDSWTKLGSYCSHCSKPLKDEASFDALSEAEIAAGALGGLIITATAGSFLFLNLLLMM